MKGKENILLKLGKKLQFQYEIGESINNDLFETIFKEDFIKKNYNKVSKFNNSNDNASQPEKKPKSRDKFPKSKGGVPNSKDEVPKSNDKIYFTINAKIERIKNEKINEIFIFTYDYLLKNGLLLELNKKFFRGTLFKFQSELEKAIDKINSNRNNLDKLINDYGFEFINNLSIFYINIKNINSFILGSQLYGEAKSMSKMDLNNMIEKSLSISSKNTSDIVGQSYEDNVLLYFLNHANINEESILPRLLFYMEFIIFKYSNNKIYMEFIPFNQLSKNKNENYNEMDFSFYTTKEIQIPMSSLKFRIFTNTFIYNYKTKYKVNDNSDEQLIFPEKTLSFLEMKNNIYRSDEKSIDLKNLISKIKTFISKLPIYMELYKSKKFINENCKNVKFIFFYDHHNGKLEDSMKVKNEITDTIDKKFKDIDININIQIIFGSKQIQSINYFELLLENKQIKEENKQIKEENKQIKEKLNELENGFKEMKELLVTKQKINTKKDYIESEKKKEEIIELNEAKAIIDEEIDKLKKNFKDIKLKIFEKAIAIPEFKNHIKEGKEDEIIQIFQKLSNKLNSRKIRKTKYEEKTINKIASELINDIIKDNKLNK